MIGTRLIVAAAFLLWSGSSFAGPRPEEVESLPTDTADPPEAKKSVPPTVSPTPPADAGEQAVADTVLPCGLRVIATRDATLPVAAVVLAVEVGTEDDPEDTPGLVHALAYQLLEGNREIRPHGAAEIVHDSGGVVGLAIGPAQVRFETVVPMNLLDEVLWIETQRLRAPTVTNETWGDALRHAQRDGNRRSPLATEAMAEAHGALVPGRTNPRAKVALDSLAPELVSRHLADRFRYSAAILIIVSPLDPDRVVERASALTRELPSTPRDVAARPMPTSTAEEPRAVTIRGEKGDTLLFPVATDGPGRAWTDVLCRTLQDQRPVAGEPPRARLRCSIVPDPRRPTMIVRAIGSDDPVALFRTRMQRIASRQDEIIFRRQRDLVRRELSLAIARPLPLARQLAAFATSGSITDAAVATGLAALGDGEAGHALLPRLLPLGSAIRLVGPGETP